VPVPDRSTARLGNSNAARKPPWSAKPSPTGVTLSTFTKGAKFYKTLLEETHVAMAVQDVRYYLNGMLLERHAGGLRSSCLYDLAHYNH
jgi:hypothetical protein